MSRALLSLAVCASIGCASSEPAEAPRPTLAPPSAVAANFATEFEETLESSTPLLGTDHPLRLDPTPTIHWRIVGIGDVRGSYHEILGARETHTNGRGWSTHMTIAPVFDPPHERVTTDRWTE